jgi:hypothetical protein
MYGRENLSLEEVVTKIISRERRMKGDEITSSSSMLLTRSEDNGKKIRPKNLMCWKCGNSKHLKRNYSGGTVFKKLFNIINTSSSV